MIVLLTYILIRTLALFFTVWLGSATGHRLHIPSTTHFRYIDVIPSGEGDAFVIVNLKCLETKLCYKDSLLQFALKERPIHIHGTQEKTIGGTPFIFLVGTEH